MVLMLGVKPSLSVPQTDVLPLHYNGDMMVGGDGLEPSKPFGDGFTARCNCRYTTRPYKNSQRQTPMLPI